MKTLKTIALLFCLAVGASACHDLEGDNSDFDLGFASGNGGSNPYVDGYDRLDNSLRLATYNTHRCEGPITQDPAYDRAHYDMTAKVISLVAPDAIALQELDEKTSWHPVSQIEELAKKLAKAFEEAGKKKGQAVRVNQVGSLLCCYFTDQVVDDYDGATSSNLTQYTKYFGNMLDHGIYVAPSQFEAMFVSAAHTEEEIEATCTIINKWA